MNSRLVLALLASLAFAIGAAAQAGGGLYTHSFSNRAGWGTHPQTITNVDGVMTVDLSSIRGATVVRAVLDPNVARYGQSPWPYLDSYVTSGGFTVFDAANQPLPLRGPRFLSVDLTAQVRAAVATGQLALRLQYNGWGDYVLALSVTCDRALPTPMPAVTGVAAVCRQGDTMITFNEINPPLTAPNTTWATFRAAADALDSAQVVRYRIYRSATPLATPADLAAAELVDEIRPLSCWDRLYFGIDEPADSTIVPRFPIADLTLAAPGTGIYVHRFRGTAPATAYYFVSRMVNGQEDLSTLTIGTNATAAVAESPGLGLVLERARELDAEHYYIEHATKHYYVRWEAPPTCTLPSTPFDYLVCEPPASARVSPAPVSLALHCWGGSLNGGYLWWYDAMQGALHVSTNQYPYDWWTAYNENYGTLKPFVAGTVQPFTQARVLSFLYDFVETRFPIDRNKILLHGMSMGGSGASMWGMRSGHIFAGIISMVGVHRPALSPVFAGSFAGVYGSTEQACRYDNSILQRFGYPLVTAADNITAWDYWDNDQWLRAHPATETPWITFANGQNDNAIGWPQAWDMTQALVDTHRGFNFIWGQGEHGQSPQQLSGFTGGDSTLQFRFNQFVPTAAHCTLNGNLGTSPETAALVGQINQYLTWDTVNVTDTATTLSFRLALSESAPVAQAGADITPRRLQVFHPAPGALCNWHAVDSSGQALASGSAAVGADGLFTLEDVVFPRLPNYATITVTTSTPPQSDYAAWRATSFGADAGNDAISGPNADPDRVGLTNFARYAFALSARGPVANPITLGTADTTSGRVLTLTFPRRSVASDLTYTLESSTDLVTWSAVPGRTYTASANPITAQDAVALGTAPRRFLRIRITSTP